MTTASIVEHFYVVEDIGTSLIFGLSGLVLVATAAHAQDLVWARSMGGTVESEIAFAIAVDGDGNVYTTGRFDGTVDFDPGPATFNLTSASSPLPDIFISKLDSAGDFVWARRMGGGPQTLVAGSPWMGTATSTRPVTSKARRTSTPARAPSI